MKSKLIAAALALSIAGVANAQDSGYTCDDLNWSAQVLAANPDIAESCQGVYERNGQLFAKANIEVTRVRGNRLTFRPMHTDGTKGKSRSITLPRTFSANIAGQTVRLSDMLPGQELSVYIPEDRFALAMDDGDFGGDEDMYAVEAAAMAAMPATASPLFTVLAGGLLALGVGVTLTARRKVRA